MVTVRRDEGQPRSRVSGPVAKLVSLAFGVAVVGAFELLLRLFGFGGVEPLLLPLLPATGDRPALFEVNPALGKNFFPNPDPGGASLLASHRREIVALPKPVGSLRIVMVGASSVEGFPMPRNLTAARFLEAWLREARPEREVEVLNFGMAAVATSPVRELALMALEEADPDILLLYAGHNEFFGAAGVASTQFSGSSVRGIDVITALRRFAIADAMTWAKSRLGRAAEQQPLTSSRRATNLIEQMAAISSIEPGGRLHLAARRNAITNMTRVVRDAKQREIPVLVATLVSNERGMAPMASWQDGEDSTLAAALDDAAALEKTDPAAAELSYDQVLARHPRHAGATWGRARALDALGRAEDASEGYIRARDLDAMPWRAGRALNSDIESMVEREGAILSPIAERFAARSMGANDWALFVDHVHMSLEGQALVAATFYDTLLENGLIGEAVAGGEERRRSSWQHVAGQLGAHPLEHYLLVHKMATLYSVPPIGLNNTETAQRLRAALAGIEGSVEPVERESIRRWRGLSEEAGFALPISFIAARVALEGKDLPRMNGYGGAAIANAFPYSDERCAAFALRELAAHANENVESAETLATAVTECELVATLPGQPSALLARSLGSLLKLSGNSQRGREYESMVHDLMPAAPSWMRAFVEMVPSEPGSVRDRARR